MKNSLNFENFKKYVTLCQLYFGTVISKLSLSFKFFSAIDNQTGTGDISQLPLNFNLLSDFEQIGSFNAAKVSYLHANFSI